MPPILFGTLREHYIVLFSTAGAVAFIAGFVGAWIGARFGVRAAVHRTAIAASDAVASRAEIHAMNTELQALLVEVERITEGQRFVAKLLAERGELGDVTPH